MHRRHALPATARPGHERHLRPLRLSVRRNAHQQHADLRQHRVNERLVQESRCRENPGKDCANIEFQLIEINLEDLTPAEINELGIVPTSLELPSKTVDQLESAGIKLMQRSKSFQRFIEGF